MSYLFNLIHNIHQIDVLVQGTFLNDREKWKLPGYFSYTQRFEIQNK